MSVKLYETPHLSKWYFGGIASVISGTVMHPLELLKVQLQTRGNITFFQIIKRVIREHGILGFFNGLTPAWMVQFVYASIRFPIFQTFKVMFPKQSFFMRIIIGGFAGFCGGFAANAFDVVKVTMQNESKLPPEERKNYKNGFHGLIRIWRDDGFLKLYRGLAFGTARSSVMSIGQLAVYDQVKQLFLSTGLTIFKDAILNHFISSFIAGIVAVTITQPVDVMKTRVMAADPGTYTGLWDCFIGTAKEGIQAFYKGVLIAGIRTMAMTVITFVVLEQLRQNFGYLPPEENIPITDAASNLTAPTAAAPE